MPVAALFVCFLDIKFGTILPSPVDSICIPSKPKSSLIRKDHNSSCVRNSKQKQLGFVFLRTVITNSALRDLC
ncbi:hypothetical protein HanRHA438_Chr09g0402391 [Helianthus annuus]|nr:hypothetical protein HanRHA438_Chr09g0402391 [Helianthus annuus]